MQKFLTDFDKATPGRPCIRWLSLHNFRDAVVLEVTTKVGKIGTTTGIWSRLLRLGLASGFDVVMPSYYYAVQEGRNPGIYNTWAECEQQVKGSSGAKYKKFSSYNEAVEFVEGRPSTSNFHSGAGNDHRKTSDTRALSNSCTSRFSQPWLAEPVVVYTDGCCIDNGKPGARAGMGVYWGSGSPDNLSERLGGRQTNNRAEIHACCLAIRQAKDMGVQSLCIRTDSKFTINGITRWIDSWKNNGWRLTDGSPVKNREDFEELERLCGEIDVKFEYVPGHSGNPGNDAADYLAVCGAQKDC